MSKEDGLFCFKWLQGHLHWLRSENQNFRCLYLLKPRPPLAGIDLSPPGASASGDSMHQKIGAFLRDANLRGAYLTGAFLIRTDLSHADLYGAKLTGAFLEGAALRGANLTGAELYGADLRSSLKGTSKNW